MKISVFCYKRLNVIISLLLSTVLLLTISACSIIKINADAADLMGGISPKPVSEKKANEVFIKNTTDFSFKLFKETIEEKKNSLISPLSVLLALSMTANGADNETLRQMEALLGNNMPIDELNKYLHTYVKGLPSFRKSKISIANSIWFREDMSVKKEFLQKNADYYKADIYKIKFDEKAMNLINNWVKRKTDNMIDSILDNKPEAMMYLINAVAFDSKWENVYNTNDIYEDDFTDINGNKQNNVKYMSSDEFIYLNDGKATGFIKPYADNKYSFVALLPNENIPLKDYINLLSGESFLNIIKTAEKTSVSARMPKFSYNYIIHMNDALINLGMKDAFNNADFSKIAGGLYIGDVLHKTFISVDELGTKAGAATKVELTKACTNTTNVVDLNRPFVYAIIDNATNLPIFIGTIMNLK